MPNWCNNQVSIQHEDRSKLEALAEAIKAGDFLKHICPVPEELNIVAGRVGDDSDPDQQELERRQAANKKKYGYSNWYDYCVGEWGTKWDIDPYDASTVVIDEDNVIEFAFDSAWSPPVGIYEKMADQGYVIHAYYYEPGMAYCGEWLEGSDNYYEISGMSADEVRDEIGEFLDDMFGISESMREYEEMEEQEELYTWVKEGGEAKGLTNPAEDK